jgi:hypothetical protein
VYEELAVKAKLQITALVREIRQGQRFPHERFPTLLERALP